MKFAILLLLTFVVSSADAQSLKDMLYKGKLKKDTTAVIRKTDDLSTKMIDTTRKAETIVDTIVVISDSAKANTQPSQRKLEMVDSVRADGSGLVDSVVVLVDTTVAAPEPPAPPVAASVKSNNRIWKEYTDSLYTSLKSEVLTNKKIKKETYYVTVDYEISPEGEVSILNVIASPENELLQNQIKDRLISAPPVLAPSAKKVKRKYNFTVTKE
jgi:hypothetical protein